jgi:hypothetical protein
LLLVFCFGLISALAEQPPSPQQLLDAVHKATDVSAAGAYILHGTIAINPGDPKLERKAKFTILRDHKRARFTLESDGRTEERVILGSKVFVVPGQGTLVAMGLKDFDFSWDPGRPRFASHEVVSFGSVRKQKVQGHDAWCFDRKIKYKTKLCFDAATSVLLHEASSEKSHQEYSDYASFGTSLYPRKVQIFRENLAPLKFSRYPSLQPNSMTLLLNCPNIRLKWRPATLKSLLSLSIHLNRNSQTLRAAPTHRVWCICMS